MNRYLALAIGGDSGDASTTLVLPKPIDHLVNDPKVLSNILQTGFRLAVFIASLAALAYTLYQAYRWSTSQGDKKIIEESSGAFWHGILGLIIILSSFFVLNIIGYFFQINFFRFSLK